MDASPASHKDKSPSHTWLMFHAPKPRLAPDSYWRAHTPAWCASAWQGREATLISWLRYWRS